MSNDEYDVECTNSSDDGTSSSTADDDDALASCFDFRPRTRSFELISTSSQSRLTLLTCMLCSGFESAVRCVTHKSTQLASPSSTRRCVTGASASPRPLVLPPPSCISGVIGRAGGRSQWQESADSSTHSDVTGHVTVRDPGLTTSRCGHARHKQPSLQQQRHQKMMIDQLMCYVQPMSSSSSLSGLHSKRTSFHREVQVIEIDQTQRVRRTGAALSRHTEQLRESDTVG